MLCNRGSRRTAEGGYDTTSPLPQSSPLTISLRGILDWRPIAWDILNSHIGACDVQPSTSMAYAMA